MNLKNVLKNILLFIGLMLIASGNVFIQELQNLDEIWIYNFARCIHDGLLPYKDFSIIITPLFPMISAIFLKIFGNEMVSLRIAETIQIVAIIFMTFKILRRLGVNRGIALSLIIGLYYMYYQVFCFDYNWAVLLVTLLILYMELKDYKEDLKFNPKKDLFLGILARS